MLDPKTLLANARILAAHLSVEGLTVDAVNRDALLEADQKIKSGQFNLEDEQKLNAVTSELARLAKPASLQDLRAALDKGRGIRGVFRLSTMLPIVSVILVFLVIGLTTNFTEITGRIGELKSLEQEHYWDKLEHAQRVYAGFPGSNRIEEKTYTDFASEISKLRDVAGGLGLAGAVIRPIIDAASGGPDWCYLTLRFYGLSRWCGSTFAISAPANAEPVNADTPRSTEPGTELPSSSDKPASIPEVAAASAVTTSAAKAAALDAANPTGAIQPAKSLNDGVRFAVVFGLNITSPDQMQYAYLSRRQAESVAIFLGSSILPLLYGLLGASVFLMRQMFGESQPGAIVANTTAKAILRLGLGGIAGLAIGWFWAPDAAKSISEISKLSTAPFALAFLAGFSIELLFSLLDRIIAALNPASVPASGAGANKI